MKKTVVINVVGLTQRLIGEHTPFIQSFLEKGKSAIIHPVVPAVTCTAQSTYVTGKPPSEHGIVGNGWYFKTECEIKFWRQSNKLVQAEKIWEKLQKADPHFTCANLFWWYNMYSTADYAVTPRPNYLADGRKIPDIYSHPAELRDTLQTELGQFPLFSFWGPKTSIKASQWIADAAIRTGQILNPTLSLIYLPHLDYNLQRHGIDFKKIKKDTPGNRWRSKATGRTFSKARYPDYPFVGIRYHRRKKSDSHKPNFTFKWLFGNSNRKGIGAVGCRCEPCFCRGGPPDCPRLPERPFGKRGGKGFA